jgi:hypothetical protein
MTAMDLEVRPSVSKNCIEIPASPTYAGFIRAISANARTDFLILDSSRVVRGAKRS